MLHGGRARDLLEAAADDPDPEVRGAVRVVLERLDPKPVAVGPAGPLIDLSAIGLVTLEARGPIWGVFRRLGQVQEGLYALPPAAREKEAEVHVEGEPIFRVVDLIAAGVGLDGSAPYDPGGTLTLREPREGQEPVPTVSLGPLRGRIVRVTTVRTLGGTTPRTHSLALQLQWAPAIQVVSLEGPRVESAEDEKGNAFRSPPGGPVSYGLSPASTSIELTVGLQPAPAAAPTGERLAHVDLVAPMRVRTGRASVDFRRGKEESQTIPVTAAQTGGKTGGEVVLRRMESPEAPGGTWLVEVRATLDAEAARESVRASLLAGDGSVGALGLTTRSVSADGTVELVGRGRLASGTSPTGVRVSWFTQEGRAEPRLRFEDVPLR